jgi:outer membrane lipoprotein SlyB
MDLLRNIVLIFFLVLTVSACEPNNDKIPKQEQGKIQSVLTGTIISIRAVSIQPSDSVRYGAVAGAVTGAAIGQSIGTSTNSRIAGGVIGGTLGAHRSKTPRDCSEAYCPIGL